MQAQEVATQEIRKTLMQDDQLSASLAFEESLDFDAPQEAEEDAEVQDDQLSASLASGISASSAEFSSFEEAKEQQEDQLSASPAKVHEASGQISSTDEEFKPPREGLNENELRLLDEILYLTRNKKVSNAHIRAMSREQAQFILDHMQLFPSNIKQKIEKRLEWLSDERHQQCFISAVEGADPDNFQSENAIKSTLARQRLIHLGLICMKTGQKLTKTAIEKKHISETRFEVEKMQFTDTGGLLTTYCPQLNTPDIAFDMNSYDRTIIEGFDELDPHMQDIIILYAHDKCVNNTKGKGEFDKAFKQMIDDIPPSEYEGKTKDQIKDELMIQIKEWWHNHICFSYADGTTKMHARTSAMDNHVLVKYKCIKQCSFKGVEIVSISYSIFRIPNDDNSPAKKDQFNINADEIATPKDIEKAITEHILDHVFFVDQNSEIEFETDTDFDFFFNYHPRIYVMAVANEKEKFIKFMYQGEVHTLALDYDNTADEDTKKEYVKESIMRYMREEMLIDPMNVDFNITVPLSDKIIGAGITIAQEFRRDQRLPEKPHTSLPSKISKKLLQFAKRTFPFGVIASITDLSDKLPDDKKEAFKEARNKTINLLFQEVKKADIKIEKNIIVCKNKTQKDHFIQLIKQMDNQLTERF